MKPAIEIPKIKTATEISLRVGGLIMALHSNLFFRHYDDSSCCRFFSHRALAALRADSPKSTRISIALFPKRTSIFYR
jgi:hypothetical protein